MTHSPAKPHFSSTNPHRALMVVTGLLALGITGATAAGWIWYFKERDIRVRIASLGAKYEKRGPAVPGVAEGGEATPNAAEASNGAVPRLKRPGSTAASSIGMRPGLPSDTPSLAPPDGLALTDMVKAEALPTAGAQIQLLPGQLPPEDKLASSEILQRYWRATDWEGKIASVLYPEKAKVSMQDFYEVQKQTDPTLGALGGVQRYRFNGVEIITYGYAGSRLKGRVEMALLKDAEGKWKLDWESFVGYSEMAWGQFKKERPTGAKLFRVFADRGDYWNFEFSEESKFLSVQMLSPDGLTSIHGYCERASSLGQEVESVLSRSQGVQALTLRLAFPEKAESDHCVRILGLVSERWLLTSVR